MGSLRPRDPRLSYQHRAVLVPSIHGSLLVYFLQTPLAECLDDNGCEGSPCYCRVRGSKIKPKTKILVQFNWPNTFFLQNSGNTRKLRGQCHGYFERF